MLWLFPGLLVLLQSISSRVSPILFFLDFFRENLGVLFRKLFGGEGGFSLGVNIGFCSDGVFCCRLDVSCVWDVGVILAAHQAVKQFFWRTLGRHPQRPLGRRRLI